MRRLPLVLLILVAIVASGCATEPTVGLMDVAERPAEHALLAGVVAYDSAQYPEAERQLGRALELGLASPKDRAAANKYLAFIYCTSARTTECETAFRVARIADPSFALSRAEAGHPMWGPVYRRVEGAHE
jgi:hypothetical protein